MFIEALLFGDLVLHVVVLGFLEFGYLLIWYPLLSGLD